MLTHLGQCVGPAEISSALKRAGWVAVPTGETTKEGIAQRMLQILAQLGEIVPGRNRTPIEEVVPETMETARPRSLSSRFGLSPLPLHTDTAHWSIPCRFLALACVAPGPQPTPTLLLDIKIVNLSIRDQLACMSSIFAIKNGRSSFYGSILERGRPFIRLDPGCMEPLTPDSKLALSAFDIQRQAERIHWHEWTLGGLLILDNWRLLHARGYNRPTGRGRLLLRAMVR
jgi:hypothetical protein